MNYLKIRMITAVVVVFICASGTYADDVMDAINEAIEAYQEKDYTDAAESLDYAKQLIQRLTSEGLKKFLPEPLEGWQANDATSQNFGMLGGSAGIERKYFKNGSGNEGRKHLTMAIMGESAMFGGMMQMFNPVIATADGGKLIKIKRNKSVVKYKSDMKEGEIFINVDRKYIVTIKGSNVTEQDLMEYAKAFDYKGLKAF